MTGSVRPRIASVVAVIWLYLGPPWVLIGAFGLYGYWWIAGAVAELGGNDPRAEVPLVFLWFPACTLVLGLAGTKGAFALLGNRESGRFLMRLVNAGAALMILAFTANWMHGVTQASRFGGASWEQVQMALFGLLVGVLTALPFIIIARKLGSPELRILMQ